MTFKYISFKLVEDRSRTRTWICSNIKSEEAIGTVHWQNDGRQYRFYPHRDTCYSKGHLEDIVTFITQQMAARRKRRRVREEKGL